MEVYAEGFDCLRWWRGGLPSLWEPELARALELDEWVEHVTGGDEDLRLRVDPSGVGSVAEDLRRDPPGSLDMRRRLSLTGPPAGGQGV
jgi:hypothetical protein